MTKLGAIGKTSAKGGFNLFIGETLSKAISAVGTMLVARLLGPSSFGLVSVALTFPLTVVSFRDLGVNAAITRFIAKYRAEDKPEETKRILATGILVDLTLSAILSLTVFLLAGPIANDLFGRPSIKYLIEIGSLSILGWALVTVSESAFIGFERMGANSIIKTLHNSFKTVLQVLLVLFGFGALGSVVGQTLALFLAGAIGICLAFFLLYRKYRTGNNGLRLSRTLKTMLRYSLPLYFSSLLLAILSQFTDIMTAIYCSDIAIGNYRAATSLIQIISFFTLPIGTVLFPAFSKVGRDETGNLRVMFHLAVKYTALITIPISMAIVVLSTPITNIIYGSSYDQASLFLSLSALGHFGLGLGGLVLGSFLRGQAETWVNAKLTLAMLAVNVPLGLLLIPRFGIFGVIALAIIAPIQILVIGLRWIRRTYGIGPDWNSSFRIYLSSGSTALVTYIVLSRLTFSGWTQLMVGGSIFLALLLLMMPLFGAVDQKDLDNLKGISGDLGAIRIIFNIPLWIVERIMSLRTILMVRPAK